MEKQSIRNLRSLAPLSGIFLSDDEDDDPCIELIECDVPIVPTDPSSCKKYIPVRLHNDIHLRKRWQNSEARIKIAVLRQKHSWAPLNVSAEMFESFMAFTKGFNELRDLAHCFRHKIANIESGFIPCSWRQQEEKHEMAYIYKYPEKKVDYEDNVVWVVRQIGIYQQYDLATSRHIWLMILPNGDCCDAEELASQSSSENHPLMSHIGLLSSRLHDWRWYLSDFDRILQKAAAKVLSVEIERELDFIDMYEQLSRLRFVDKSIVCLQPILAGQTRVLARLKEWNRSLELSGEVDADSAQRFDVCIGNLNSAVEALQSNVAFMLSRIASAAQMGSDTISLKSQNTTESMSNHMLRDSTAVRVITIVTLVFLPATFTSGFFGMGFFTTDFDSGGEWIMAPNIWIYFVLVVPMTALTLGYWKWRSYKAKSENRSDSIV